MCQFFHINQESSNKNRYNNAFYYGILQDMTLALFDLDNTLLSGDSDFEWGEYLVKRGLVDRESYAKSNQYFLEQYQQGTLNIFEYSRFSFKPLADNKREDLLNWRTDFINHTIRPMISTESKALINKHKTQGDTLVIITATNSFITRPIANLLGIKHLIATEVQQNEQGYIAEVRGIPCFKEGKVIRLKTWLKEHQMTLEGSYFYSDSHNDLPLLELVDHAFAVDPDEILETTAKTNDWPILSLR